MEGVCTIFIKLNSVDEVLTSTLLYKNAVVVVRHSNKILKVVVTDLKILK